MFKTKVIDTCFQCGKPRVQTKQYKEYFKGSLVTTVESVCSDADCQKRTTDAFNKDVARRVESIANKKIFGKKTNHT